MVFRRTHSPTASSHLRHPSSSPPQLRFPGSLDHRVAVSTSPRLSHLGARSTHGGSHAAGFFRLFCCFSCLPRRLLALLFLCFILGFLGGGVLTFAHPPLDVDRLPHSIAAGIPPPPPPPPPRPPPVVGDAVSVENNGSEKLLIIVTPTRGGARQGFFLHRLAQTLRLVRPPLLWLVVEGGKAAPSEEVARSLRSSGVMYRHLPDNTEAETEMVHQRARQRNAALEHVELHRINGVLYFADEEGVYSLELFDRLRDVRNFGTWPVATIEQSSVLKTVVGSVCNGTRVTGWHTEKKGKKLKRFHAHMSGFAFNSSMLWNTEKRLHNVWNPIRQPEAAAEEELQVSRFIEQLVEDESQMEGIPSGCSRIMNYHLHREGGDDRPYPKGWEVSENLDAVVPLMIEEQQHYF